MTLQTLKVFIEHALSVIVFLSDRLETHSSSLTQIIVISNLTKTYYFMYTSYHVGNRKPNQ